MMVIRGLKNGKAPGLDKVYNYWYKHILSLRERLRFALNNALQHPETVPRWITGGVTTLLYKK
eukprot:9053844-Ditylum_brightwellii.AAC.1